MLAINDQYAPAAAFLGSAKVNRNFAHVTFAADTSRDHSELGLLADHAYWVSAVKLRGGERRHFPAAPLGFGGGTPPASLTQVGSGSLTGGSLGRLLFDSRRKTW